MNYFSLPIIILSAISLYLAVYYLILSIKHARLKPYLVISAACFFYFIYDCARIGIYNSQARFWNYFWLYTSLADIPIIAICIVLLIINIFKYERIAWHNDYLIIIGIYAMIAIGMIFESAMLFKESYSIVLTSRINTSPLPPFDRRDRNNHQIDVMVQVVAGAQSGLTGLADTCRCLTASPTFAPIGLMCPHSVKSPGRRITPLCRRYASPVVDRLTNPEIECWDYVKYRFARSG